MADRTKVTITILVILVVLLAAVLVYLFVVQPAIQGYNIQRQSEGVQIAVSAILTQLQQQGFVQIPLGENQTLILVQWTPQQQPAE